MRSSAPFREGGGERGAPRPPPFSDGAAKLARGRELGTRQPWAGGRGDGQRPGAPAQPTAAPLPVRASRAPGSPICGPLGCVCAPSHVTTCVYLGARECVHTCSLGSLHTAMGNRHTHVNPQGSPRPGLFGGWRGKGQARSLRLIPSSRNCLRIPGEPTSWLPGSSGGPRRRRARPAVLPRARSRALFCSLGPRPAWLPVQQRAADRWAAGTAPRDQQRATQSLRLVLAVPHTVPQRSRGS